MSLAKVRRIISTRLTYSTLKVILMIMRSRLEWTLPRESHSANKKSLHFARKYFAVKSRSQRSLALISQHLQISWSREGSAISKTNHFQISAVPHGSNLCHQTRQCRTLADLRRRREPDYGLFHHSGRNPFLKTNRSSTGSDHFLKTVSS
jgi:hypothetical protein